MKQIGRIQLCQLFLT